MYKTNITSATGNYRNKTYYGISDTKFKSRYANLRKSFKNRIYKTDTGYSNEIWKLKERSKDNISWEVLGIHQSYNAAKNEKSKRLNEKIAIALHLEDNILNKRTEIISKCRHTSKYNVVNYDTKDLY